MFKTDSSFPSPLRRGPTGRPDYAARRSRLVARVADSTCGAGACLVCDPLDIRYLTGVHEGISWLIVTPDQCIGLSRHMLFEEVREAAPDCEIVLPVRRSTDRPDLAGFLVAELEHRGQKSALIDPAKISASSYLRLCDRARATDLRIHWQPDPVPSLRAVKDAGETEQIGRCIEISEKAFGLLIAEGAAGLLGRTEREIALELEAHMLELGADCQGFPGTGLIVACGPNSASGHHRPGTRRVAVGDALLIDWGAELDGYRSDLTRTIFPGGVPEFASAAYPVVEAALRAAVGCLGDHVPMGEVDRAARQTVIDAGYPEFHYGLGHGFGLAIHEAPWIRANSDDRLAAEMVTTIEPGIYLRGIGGIRIENVYRVTPGGHERLGELPFDLESMILE